MIYDVEVIYHYKTYILPIIHVLLILKIIFKYYFLIIKICICMIEL